MVYCPNCGGNVADKSRFCSFCGYDMKNMKSTESNPNANQQAYTEDYQQAQTGYQQNQSGYQPNQSGYQQPAGYSLSGSFTSAPKERLVAAIFAILLGGFGIHKFYLGNIGMGIFYLIFSWTGIPEVIGFIEGIIYLTKTDEQFYHDHVLPIEQQNSMRV
ncbi:MAG: NINE protein [Promethearchaeota archaeon]